MTEPRGAEPPEVEGGPNASLLQAVAEFDREHRGGVVVSHPGVLTYTRVRELLLARVGPDEIQRIENGPDPVGAMFARARARGLIVDWQHGAASRVYERFRGSGAHDGPQDGRT